MIHALNRKKTKMRREKVAFHAGRTIREELKYSKKSNETKKWLGNTFV